MSNQKLGILAVVAAVMILWAVVQSRLTDGGRSRPSGPAYLIQGLDPSAIASIVVGQGDEAVHIERRDGQFIVVDEAGYAADTKQINDLISKCLDIKTIELYTDSPKNHEELGVTEDSARHVVKFFKADESLMTGAIIGESREAGEGTYVRQPASDDVYLAKETPYLRTRALDYVNQEIVSVKREDVNSVTVQTGDGVYTLQSRDDAADVVMADLPADKQLKDSDAKSVLTAIVGLRFDDVNKPAEIEGLNFDHQYIVRLDGATQYRFLLAKKGDKTYLKAEAEYTDQTKVTMTMGQAESEEELKKKEAKLLAQENVQRFNLRHRGWVYEIPDWKAKNMLMAQAELFEDEPEPEPEAEEETAEVSETEPTVAPAEILAPAEMGPAEPPSVAPAAPEEPAKEPNEPSGETVAPATPAPGPNG